MMPFTTHVQRALERLITKFKDKPVVVGFVTALAQEVQELEDAVYDVWLNRTLDTATGDSLDMWGALLGRARGLLEDDDYRIRLKVKVLLLRASGTIPELMQAFMLLAPSPREVSLIARWNAAFELLILGATSEGDEFHSVLQEAKAAGVRATLRYSGVDASDTFATLGAGGKGFTSIGSPAGTGGLMSRARG